jgi:hypothetical protein
LNVPAAPAFSECAVISVASTSMMIRSGAAPASQAAARPRSRRPQRVEQARLAGDPIDHPKRRRVRGDRPEQHLLIADRAQVG